MTAATVPQIVPGTLTGDLDITSFTVEHYPGDALGIAVRAPRMNWTYSHTVPEDAQILLTLTRRVPGSKPREEKTICRRRRRACACSSSRSSPAKKCLPPCRLSPPVTSRWAQSAAPCILKPAFLKNSTTLPTS